MNGRFDEDKPLHDDCNAPENREIFTDYYGTRERAKKLPGEINANNDCSWFIEGFSYIPPE